jgi:uncharacterized protein (UPF0332 family)
MVERISLEDAKLLAHDEFQRAQEEITAAKVLKDNELFFKSVVSSYYAVYHGAKAALLNKGVSPKSHEGIERMFSLYYVKVNLIETDIGRIIGRLMKLREEADYYPETSFNLKDSSEAIEMAERFLENIRKVVKFE